LDGASIAWAIWYVLSSSEHFIWRMTNQVVATCSEYLLSLRAYAAFSLASSRSSVAHCFPLCPDIPSVQRTTCSWRI
jgi:hypothetical protein